MSPPVGYRTVLLDLDGTLIDSEELILASYRHTMRVHRGGTPPDDAWLETMGQPLLTQLRDFARDEEEARAMLETYEEHTARVHDDLLRPFEGTRDYVAGLRDGGYRLAVVTSKRRELALRGLASCGFRTEWFDALVTASDVEAHKPSPEPVRDALDHAGERRPGRAVFVGDSIYDLRAGRAAGVGTAAALWGPYGRQALAPAEPDHWLDRLPELDALLARSGSDDRPDGRAARLEG